MIPSRRNGCRGVLPLEQRVAWWNENSKSYPFHAESPISVRHDTVAAALETQFISVPLRVGWRSWGFRTAEERNLFCLQFGGEPIAW
jgi:hypothetical protein